MVQKANHLVFIILVGMPCSGKSTWVMKNKDKLIDEYEAPIVVISRDIIRDKLFGKAYSSRNHNGYSEQNEKLVTQRYYKELSQAVALQHAIIILDNTHVKKGRINAYFTSFKSLIESGAATIYVKFFDVPLWKAKWRNYWREKSTTKWVPVPVLETMYNNYIGINKEEYKDYLYED
jgi:predicted kinase